MDVKQVTELLHRVFPQVKDTFEILELPPRGAKIVLLVGTQHLRPGGTVSGPAIFSLVDAAFYVAILAHIGPEVLAVTTNVSINYMRKPDPQNLVAEARILKQGRSLCVGDVTVYNDDPAHPVAHATLTYSMPPKRV